MQKRVSFKYRGKKISVMAEEMGFLKRGWGLMFSKRENAKILSFDFKTPTLASIHSLFVFFPFIAVWLDEKGEVLEVRNVEPFTFSVKPKKKFSSLIEIPLSQRYRSLTEIFPRR